MLLPGLAEILWRSYTVLTREGLNPGASALVSPHSDEPFGGAHPPRQRPAYHGKVHNGTALFLPRSRIDKTAQTIYYGSQRGNYSAHSCGVLHAARFVWR